MRIYSTGFCGTEVHSLHLLPAPRFYFVPQMFQYSLFPAISIVFLCLLARRIAKRLTGDAVVGQRRLLNDSVSLGAEWRHVVSLGRWLW